MPPTIVRPADRKDADVFIAWDCALCGLVLRCPHFALVRKADLSDNLRYMLADGEGD